jgi:outer membrane protein OmpA-like peptidoglycan-associated protein
LNSRKFLFAVIICASKKITAQNLFANAGFEAINNCTEFKADCAPEAWFNIPAGNFLVNGRKAPSALLGNMVLIVPAGNVMQNFNKPRYVYTGICCPLVKDTKYNLSFYINTSTISFSGLSLYFTAKEPALTTVNSLPETPATIISKELLTEMPGSKWFFVQHSFTATGSEKFFIFTTKGTLAITYEMKDAMNKSGDVLYFIDEINLQSEEAVPICADFEKNTTQLFAYNNRHTDNYPVFKEVQQPEKPLPKFTHDTITIPGLLFDVNKSNIKPAVAKILDSIISMLQLKQYAFINITGHTDSTGNETDNQLLSEARAARIKNYLAQKLQPQKITASGKAATIPVADNATAVGRQRNRRVEIIITYPKQLQ